MPVTDAYLVAGEPVCSVVRWRSSAAASRPGRAAAVSGDVVAADATTGGPASLKVADVICCDSVGALTGILERYPGCAVATAPATDGEILAVTRAWCPLSVSYRARDAPGSGALVCAIFVHAWLAAGWPLSALRPARLTAVTRWAATLTPPAPVPFLLYC
ncbi:MAG TPA: hypothetical protein VN969_01350 [Streptosporangiaceae bacterium]|jgi:hypothetical protein|nr:hypothetical protein [Streptosporangiaceae bacterium]